MELRPDNEMRGRDLFEGEFLASLYDHFNPWAACNDFYLGLAREIGGCVLDLGCGTGALACRIAMEGLSVTGVDPSEAMLRVARSRLGGERVSWIQTQGQALHVPQRFDFIYMTGHAFQALMTDDDIVGLLRAVRGHLTGSGRFVFETRNPAREAWLSWTPDQRNCVATREHGRIEETRTAIADATTGIVDLTHNYRFLDTGKTVTGHTRLRFIDRDHLRRLLAAAGLRPQAWYGDWYRTPLTEASPEIIVVAGIA